jgi:CheY-like chemotaxis protein/nitrogen-specific signal transduction histidine kinase
MHGLDFAQRATILVVDDTPDNLVLMSNLLKDTYMVKVANSGQKALKIASLDPAPDLILLDIMMPGMDGYEVCQRLKSDIRTTDIPVIFLTAKAEMEDEKKGLELGAVDYITKPISPPVVLARVRSHLALKGMADFLRDKNTLLEIEVTKRTRELMAIQEFEVANRQLREASRMKSEFLANMSHELRTPLNAIIGFSEVLKDGLLGELEAKQQEYVNDIFTSGNHLLLLINDILDLSKVEAGKMNLELEPLDAASLVRGSLQVVREKAMTHHLRLVAEIADGLDTLGDVWLDQRKVKQILYNLLSNAVKFTPEGGEVRVTTRQVGREAVPDGHYDRYLELAVSDTGIGISAEDQTRLFKAFTQIDSTLARRYNGTGLGLAMVKRLAELHGGAVALRSTPEIGSTFTVWLPWRTDADADAPAPAPADSLSPAADSSAAAVIDPGQPLALVIEDDDLAAELLRLQLENAGFRVARAATAESALQLAAQECPDLITLDIMLPGMNGWDFLKRFKRYPQYAGVPVVIVSIVADRNRGLSLGASQVLQKPVGRKQLERALAAAGIPAAANGSQHTVLVVDDDPKAIKLLRSYLESAGYRVLSATNWQEGIDLARQQHPDLIVLDLLMPEVNGFEVVEALKRDAAMATIPIVIVTAKQMSAEDHIRLNGDVMKVIEKAEFDQGQFIGEVKRAMSWKGS